MPLNGHLLHTGIQIRAVGPIAFAYYRQKQF